MIEILKDFGQFMKKTIMKVFLICSDKREKNKEDYDDGFEYNILQSKPTLKTIYEDK